METIIITAMGTIITIMSMDMITDRRIMLLMITGSEILLPQPLIRDLVVLSNVKQCKKNAVTPQHGTIFCYNADELGWSPRNPEWDTRMEVRCGAGYWKDGTYKKKNYSDTRWFYCHKGKWYGSHYNGNEIEKLENGFDIEHSVCYDHASGDDFKGSCDIEHHNWGPHTRYDCVYHSYPYGHKHYQEAVHGYYPHHTKKPKKDKYHKHTDHHHYGGGHHHGHGHHHHAGRKRRDLLDMEGNPVSLNMTE